MGRIPITLVLATALLTGLPAVAQKLLTPSTPNAPTSPGQPTAADPAVQDIRPNGPPILIYVSQGTMLRLPAIPSTVFVADSQIADAVIQPQPPDAVLLTGKKEGSTVVYAVDGAGKVLLNRSVEVKGGPVTIFRGSKADTGEQPPIVLTIPLSPAAPAAK